MKHILIEELHQIEQYEKMKAKEKESVRLAKAVCEYERIDSDLEEELHIARELNKHHEETIDKLISRYNALVHKYNNLLNYID